MSYHLTCGVMCLTEESENVKITFTPTLVMFNPYPANTQSD